MWRHVQRAQAVATQAQPMMLKTDNGNSTLQPSKGQKPPVKRSGCYCPSHVMLATSQRWISSSKKA